MEFQPACNKRLLLVFTLVLALASLSYWTFFVFLRPQQDVSINNASSASSYSMPLPSRRLAFVTLVTSESYVPGAAVLLYTWRKHTPKELNIDTIALVLPNTLPEYCLQILQEVGWTLHNITALSKVRKEGQKRLSINFTKLKLWSSETNFSSYDQVLFADSDIVIIQEIYQALEEQYSPFAASLVNTKFNSGILSLKPDNQVCLSVNHSMLTFTKRLIQTFCSYFMKMITKFKQEGIKT